jgi:uncharacterized protein (DUF849 family)/GNAT superfamily N-acetyltransferase
MGSREYLPHPLRAYPPLIVNVALTGMIPMRHRVPRVPVTPEQIVRDACLCCEAGAAILHLHARDAEGKPEWRKEAYEQLIPAIRRRCPDVVICVTTSGRAFGDLEKRADVLRLSGAARPDMASLTLGSMNFGDSASVNSPATIQALAERMLDAGILPELEVFDSGMAYYAHHLAARRILREPFYANIILGSINTAPARARDLAHLVDALPSGTVWAAGGLGGFQLPMNSMAILMGGHVRTGLEDNPYLDYATRTPASNAALVSRLCTIASIAGRRLAAPAEVREWLGLRPLPPRGYTIRPMVQPQDRQAMLKILEVFNMHRVPSDEMTDFDIGTWFVAEIDGSVVGLGGFGFLHEAGELIGKTKLLAVHPDAASHGIGRALQELRMGLMRDAGAARVRTCADRPQTIDWYKRNFGYEEVGTIPKLHEFGLPTVDYWTVLEAPL